MSEFRRSSSSVFISGTQHSSLRPIKTSSMTLRSRALSDLIAMRPVIAAILDFFHLVTSLSSFLAFGSSQKDVILRRFGFTRSLNRPSTPTLEKQPLSKSLASYASNLVTAFPPSQRDQLKELVPGLSLAQQKALGDISFNQATFKRSLLRFGEDYNKVDYSKYVYSGFSTREIKVLGDFPDYSTLSGVPTPSPYLEFDINKAKPRPYRPFRWPYHQTMSLTKLEPDWWIELESTYKERIAQRKSLYAKHGQAVLQWLPGSELACKELMEMAIQFICARYPQYFALSEDRLWLENKILNVRANIREKHPLFVLLDHIPEDFAITLRDPDTGYYVFRAGIICSAIGWNLASKIGLNFFSKMPTSKPIQRGSWDLEVDKPLFMPPGGDRHSQDENLTPSRVHLRVDWQTLRRIPLSGGIVFNFKALFTPIEEFRDEAYIPSLLLQVLHHAKENLMKYKHAPHMKHLVVPLLKQYEMEQKASGLMDKDWDARTLDEHPLYPQWEKKWHAQQGF
ncbi:alpha-1,2-mannosyltransferase [Xylaria sp. FL1777]|nr:alpha-1,2-mannosyltransferase [Xylaria sp. FL1777]